MLGSGGMLANLRPGPSQSKDAWQFASADLLQVFADWQKSLTDVQFQKNQLTLITELNDKRIERQKLVVKRKRELLTIGTETIENLALEETNLIAFEIQRRKEIHEQATAVNLAERTAATLARQLQQNGLEPTMLRSAASEGEIVVAEVPETMIRHVKVGMHCKVEFFALPDHKPAFSGKVSSISPAISKEKRVANVQFIVKDPDKAIRPGMFARIGLGDERKALVMPADGVLHVGDHDYALVADDKGKSPSWQIFQVETGELVKTEIDALPGQLVKSDIEVLSGYALENPARRLQKDDRVIGKGAILLKPVVIRALQAPMAK
jgi:multidrug efflux pump subunit AcrA (membrane-fusion protein)